MTTGYVQSALMYLQLTCSDGARRSIGRDAVSDAPPSHPVPPSEHCRLFMHRAAGGAAGGTAVRSWPCSRSGRGPHGVEHAAHCLIFQSAAAGLPRPQAAPVGRPPTVVAGTTEAAGAPGARYFATFEYQGLDVLADLFGSNPGAVVDPFTGMTAPAAAGSARCPQGEAAAAAGAHGGAPSLFAAVPQRTPRGTARALCRPRVRAGSRLGCASCTPPLRCAPGGERFLPGRLLLAWRNAGMALRGLRARVGTYTPSSGQPPVPVMRYVSVRLSRWHARRGRAATAGRLCGCWHQLAQSRPRLCAA